MDSPLYPLSELEEAYIDHHKALGRSAKTWQRHQSTHRLFHKFLVESQIPADSRVVSTDVMRKFSTWLQATPIERSCRGTNQRSIHGIRGALKDMRALTHWLVEEERLGKEPKIPIPKLPDTLFPIHDQTHLEQMWGSKYLSGRSSMATRNRALIGLMLDTGRSGEPHGQFTWPYGLWVDCHRQGTQTTTSPVFQRGQGLAGGLDCDTGDRGTAHCSGCRHQAYARCFEPSRMRWDWSGSIPICSGIRRQRLWFATMQIWSQSGEFSDTRIFRPRSNTCR